MEEIYCGKCDKLFHINDMSRLNSGCKTGECKKCRNKAKAKNSKLKLVKMNPAKYRHCIDCTNYFSHFTRGTAQSRRPQNKCPKCDSINFIQVTPEFLCKLTTV